MERLQGQRPWGSVLDAGTGLNSLRWIESLATERWTAVAGSGSEARRAEQARQSPVRNTDRIIVGNWVDETLLQGEHFDTVIADYLLGAIEGFAPYFQPYLFKRLRPLTGQTLYVTGLEPYVPLVRPELEAARMVWEIGRFRDACVLLTGGLPYREYPMRWVKDQLRQAGFEVRHTQSFTIGYKALFVKAQINIALSGLDRLEDKSLADALQQRGRALREDALDMINDKGALRACRNYVIAATPV